MLVAMAGTMISRCPSCAAQVKEDAAQCPSCHWDFAARRRLAPGETSIRFQRSGAASATASQPKLQHFADDPDLDAPLRTEWLSSRQPGANWTTLPSVVSAPVPRPERPALRLRPARPGLLWFGCGAIALAGSLSLGSRLLSISGSAQPLRPVPRAFVVGGTDMHPAPEPAPRRESTAAAVAPPKTTPRAAQISLAPAAAPPPAAQPAPAVVKPTAPPLPLPGGLPLLAPEPVKPAKVSAAPLPGYAAQPRATPIRRAAPSRRAASGRRAAPARWTLAGEAYDLLTLHPVYLAELSFRDSTGKLAGTTSTDEFGRFKTRLPPVSGGYILTVAHPDYVKRYLDDITPPLRLAGKKVRRDLAKALPKNEAWMALPGVISVRRDIVLIPAGAAQ